MILTSATLALGGNFDALARQWGLPPSAAAAGGVDDPVPDPDAPKWSGLDVGSPFAHARSGILYVARRLPPPDGLRRSPAVALVRRAGAVPLTTDAATLARLLREGAVSGRTAAGVLTALGVPRKEAYRLAAES